MEIYEIITLVFGIEFLPFILSIGKNYSWVYKLAGNSLALPPKYGFFIIWTILYGFLAFAIIFDQSRTGPFYFSIGFFFNLMFILVFKEKNLGLSAFCVLLSLIGFLMMFSVTSNESKIALCPNIAWLIAALFYCIILSTKRKY